MPHSEAIGIYYTLTTFQVYYSVAILERQFASLKTCLPKFLNGIGQEKVDLIRSIHLTHSGRSRSADGPRQKIIRWDQSAQQTLERAGLEIEEHAGKIAVASAVLKALMQTPAGARVYTSEPHKVRDQLLAELAD